jgi:alpha-mannosidase
MKVWLVLFLLITAVSTAVAQSPGMNLDHYISGYESKVSGTDFSYHSSIPDLKECLLVRATDGKSSMEWKTAPVKINAGDKNVTVVWLAGIGSSPGSAVFDLAVNGKPGFSFTADGSDQWVLSSENGSRLSFRKDMTDEFGDKFGLMFLTIPATQVREGEPLTLRVTGGNYNLTSWYMTFKFAFKNRLSFKPLPGIVENEGKQYQVGMAGFLYFGYPTAAKIYLDNKLLKETRLNFGYNSIRVQWPVVTKTTTVSYRLEMAGMKETGKLNLSPVRKWRVNFVQHTHTDIGYTRPQTEILAEHLRFIDYALDYCDQTDILPDAARFRWTCEAAWAVDEYLKCRPASQIERLKKRVAEGRIELTGMYFNFDELPGEQTLAASLQPLKRFREYGLTVKTAMQNDVNGIGWCLNDFFPDLGIRYLNMGTHGHRALIAFDKPTLFWWESPSGKRMLAYRGEHYMLGNTLLKIHAGDFNSFENELLTYLTNLQNKGYAYDLISIQHSGFLTDNSPPSTLACDMIRQWNDKYVWPKLKTATATEFFQEMEAKYGDSFQVIRGAWPDWWTDGFGASAREVAAVRTAQSDMISNAGGLTMAAVLGSGFPLKISDRLDAINSALLFYTEHTVGFHNSVREPFNINSMEQRALKESYAWEAGRRAKMIGEETLGLLQQFVSKESEPSIVVFNTLNWKRSGLFRIYIDHQIIPRYTSFRLTDSQGHEAIAQPVENYSDGAYWAIWVDDIPAFGFRKYLIKTGEGNNDFRDNPGISKTFEMENQYFKISVDTMRAGVTSLFDKVLNHEWVDAKAKWKAGEFIYEMLNNRQQMEAYTLNNYTRESLEKVWFEGYQKGPVWNSFRFSGSTRAANKERGYSLEIRIFNTTRRIDMVYSIEKKLVTDPEGIYIAFPLQSENGQLSFDVQGGEIRAGIDQIPGSSNDWNTVQNYARLSNAEGQVIITSPEIPLMQFGAINTGRYKAGATPATTHMFGWPMNNYWTTNFNGEQHGGHVWSYSLTSMKGNSRQDAVRTGWGNRIPFLARVLPVGGTVDKSFEGSLLKGWPENLLLVSAIPEQDGKSAILHVRETGAQGAVFSLLNGLTGAPLKAVPVDVTGEPLENVNLTLKPLESKFFRVYF